MSCIILLLLVTRVCSEIQSVRHSSYITRKSRSNSRPYRSSYSYSHHSNPGVSMSFGSNLGYDTFSNYDMMDIDRMPSSKYPNYYHSPVYKEHVPEYSQSEANLDYEISKAKAKYGTEYYPSKIHLDTTYEEPKMQRIIIPSDDELQFTYTGNDFQVDNDDIRTVASYDMGLYYPYELDIDSNLKKLQEPSQSLKLNGPVIPVHESIDYDVPNTGTSKPYLTTTPDYSVMPDNPIQNDKPFIKYVLKDYFNKNNNDDDDDPLIMKRIHWGQETFDNEVPFYESGDKELTIRKSHINNLPQSYSYYVPSSHIGNEIKSNEAQKASEKINKKEFDKKENKQEEKASHKMGFVNNKNDYNGFKNFADSFVKKAADEDHKKDSKFALSQNMDKGQNRKGFRRVYHKDEYQEDNEFFDNHNSSARAEDKGSSSAHSSGSEGLLKSNSVASLGEESKASNESGDAEKNEQESSHKGHDFTNGYSKDYNSYKGDLTDIIDRYR